MQLNNEIHNSQAFGSRLDTKKDNMINDEDKLKTATKNLAILMARGVENYVPENGKFAPFALGFELPDNQNEVKYAVEYDKNNPNDLRRLSIGAKRKHSDSITKEYILKGTKQEIIEYLNDTNNLEKLYQTVQELLDSVEARYQ